MWCRVDGLFGWPFGTLLLMGGPLNQLMTKMLSLLIISVQRWSMTAQGRSLDRSAGSGLLEINSCFAAIR